MSERLPYEEQLLRRWTELPVPDADRAWADMKRRLDEDEDDVTALPWWRRGCAVPVILLLILAGLGWWYRYTQKKPDNKQTANDSPRAVTLTDRRHQAYIDTPILKTAPGKQTDPASGFSSLSTEKKPVGVPEEKRTVSARSASIERAVRIRFRQGTVSNTVPSEHNGEPYLSNPSAIPGFPITQVIVDTTTHGMRNNGNTDKAITDSGSAKAATVTEPVSEPPQKNQAVKDGMRKNAHFFSAGFALHQQLPLGDSQRLNPYGPLGRKLTLADYIPSVYVRYHHGDRWFLQAGFRYGAPQYNKEFTYKVEKSPVTNRETVKTLKKTYYHQVPLTFQYRLLPGLTGGVGAVWNKFSSAVSHQTLIGRSPAPWPDTVLNQGVVSIKGRDSVFPKSYLQATAELQYQWKRFTLGGSYSFGLQPYIRFTLPGGTQQQEKNSSLQVFLRYELWRSEKK